MKRFVYADNAATTPVSQTVLNAMLPYYTEKYGNPSSLYAVGREAKKALEDVGLQLEFKKNEGEEKDTITEQLPKAGIKTKSGTTIIAY